MNTCVLCKREKAVCAGGYNCVSTALDSANAEIKRLELCLSEAHSLETLGKLPAVAELKFERDTFQKRCDQAREYAERQSRILEMWMDGWARPAMREQFHEQAAKAWRALTGNQFAHEREDPKPNEPLTDPFQNVPVNNLRANIKAAESAGLKRLVLSHTLAEARALADWLESGSARTGRSPARTAYDAAARRFAEALLNSNCLDAIADRDGDEAVDQKLYDEADTEYNASKAAFGVAFEALLSEENP